MIKQLILEEVYGNIVIAYHRTPVEDIIDKVYDTGWKPAGGDLYGKGFYGTFTLESQLRSEMHKYGQVIGKFRIDINNFVIFEWDIFEKIKMREYPKANEDNFIELQLRKYGIIETQEDIDFLNWEIDSSNYSSYIAKIYFNNEEYKADHVDGIIFHGRHDGDVIVCFDLSLIHPLGYSIDDGKTFIKPNEFNKQYHSKGFKSKYIDPKDKLSNLNKFYGDLSLLKKNIQLIKSNPEVLNNLDNHSLSEFFIINPDLLNLRPDLIDELPPSHWRSFYMYDLTRLEKYPEWIPYLTSYNWIQMLINNPDLYNQYRSYYDEIHVMDFIDLYNHFNYNDSGIIDMPKELHTRLSNYLNNLNTQEISQILFDRQTNIPLLLTINFPDILNKLKSKTERYYDLLLRFFNAYSSNIVRNNAMSIVKEYMKKGD